MIHRPRISDACWMPHPNSRPLISRLRLAAWMIVILGITLDARAEDTPTSEETVSAIPVASIAIEASTLENFLKGLEADLETPETLVKISDALPEVDSQLLELSKRTEENLERGYDRADLDSLDAAWRSRLQDLTTWESTLNARLTKLNNHRSQLTDRDSVWMATAAAAREDSAPPEVRTQVAQSRQALKTLGAALLEVRDRALGLQKRVIALQGRVTVARDTLIRARAEVLSHVLSRNESSFWHIRLGTELDAAQDDFLAAYHETRASIVAYAHRSSKLIWMHVLLIVLVVWASWMARTWMERPPLHGTRPVPDALTHPIAAGLVLGLSASMWLHAEAPPRLGWILGLLALPFLQFVLRSLLPPALRRPVYGLVFLVLLDLGRRVLMDFEALARSMLVLEAGIAMIGVLWLRRPERLSEVPRPANFVWIRVIGAWLFLALLGSTLSLGGATLGWTSLADLLMSALVIGSFLGLTLFTAIRVLEAIAEASVYSGKLDGIRILRNHRRTFLAIVSRVARTLGFATWVVSVLDSLTLEEATQRASLALLNAPIGYGNAQLTLGGLGAFGIAIWVSWLLARFLATLLEDEVFTRVSLPRGVPFALSTITRYTILVLGFIVAVAVLGFDVSNLALVVSALGVGIGFGMQGMVNNFISGLILLFERPIKVGDLVSLDELLGRVARIGIRSSTVRSFDGADVIVPNGDLISNRVTNWTLADTRRRVTFPVGVAYGTPARKVIGLIENVAKAHPEILAEPKPYGLFMGFGDSSLDFELRAWTESDDALTIVRSDIAIGIQEALATAGIEVPFPQRDVYLKEASTMPDTSPS